MEKLATLTNWTALINRKPNYECDFFFLADNGKSMIIDLNKMENLPLRLIQLVKNKEKAYLFIDPTNSKYARYFGFDLDDKGDFIDEEQGELMFVAIESCLIDFLETNSAKISCWTEPFAEIVEAEKKKTRIDSSASNNTTPSTTLTHSGTTYSTRNDNSYERPYYNYGGFSYNAAHYREREVFYDKVHNFVRQGKSGRAIEYIRDFLKEKMASDRELVNTILRNIIAEKWDILTLRELIMYTVGATKGELSERSAIIGKYKGLIARSHSKMRDVLIKEIDYVSA